MRKSSIRNNAARRNRKRSFDKERGGAQHDIVRYNPYPKTVVGTRGGILMVSILTVLFAVYLIATLFNIQIVSHDQFVQDAAVLRYNKVPVYPERAAIYDSTGLPLAITTYDYTIGFTPRSLGSWLADEKAPSQAELAEKIASILGIDAATMSSYLAQEDASYIQLKKNVSTDQTNELRTYLNENQAFGVVIDPVMRRRYPAGDLAASVIGFASKTGENISGVMGIEAYYDNDLRGKPGYSYTQIDNYSGRQLPFTDETSQAAIKPDALKLNINARLQEFSQSLIKQYVSSYGAKAGEIVVMNPQTGAVLAMANHTSFDLNDPYAVPEGKDSASWDPFTKDEDVEFLYSNIWVNRATQVLYEPGSTYKALTTAMAIEEKIFTEDQLFNDSPIWVKGHDAYPISCVSKWGHGSETVRMAIVRSCNPVMVQLAEKMGMQTFYDYVMAFGHQERTGVDLPAESDTYLHAEDARMPIDLANLSFGESSVITPLHLVSAFSALANGGLLMRPQVADAFVDSDGLVVRDIKPEVVRRVISTETSDQIMDYLRSHITYNDGTPEAETMGYGSAGKTSTSNFGVNDEQSVISFANIAPYYNPKVVVLAVLHEPVRGTLSKITAKMSAQVAGFALEQLGVPKDKTLSDDMWSIFMQRFVPNLSGYNFATAGKVTLPNNLYLDMEPGAPAGASVKYQYPPAAELINNRGTMYISHSGKPMTELVTVPNFANLGFEGAYKLAEEMGVNILLQGGAEGKVTDQSIEAGKTVLKYSVVKLWLK